MADTRAYTIVSTKAFLTIPSLMPIDKLIEGRTKPYRDGNEWKETIEEELQDR